MKIALLLHFYQPINQQLDILNRVVHESYLPLTRGLLKSKKGKVTINFNGSLIDLLNGTIFDNHDNAGIDTAVYKEVLENIKKLQEQGKVELTGSAKYHPFLPLIPLEEIKQQIDINTASNFTAFGEGYKPNGFFSPELAVSDKVMTAINESGYKWAACPELSYKEQHFDTFKSYKDSKTGLKLLFRNKRVSSLILSSVCRDVDDLLKETQDIYDKENYWFCVMDAETFGHHRIRHEKFLFEILDSPHFEPVTASELVSQELPEVSVDIRPSTWSNEEQDFWLDREKNQPTEARSFILWKDPENPIHTMQWDLTNHVMDYVHNFPNKDSEQYAKARHMLDMALASDQYWWASAKPWWSLEMIEMGAYEMKLVLETLGADEETMIKADNLYRGILDKAFEWQRTGVIRKKHLSNSGTYLKEPFKNRTPADWYNLMILEFESEMNIAAGRREYEKAIKWRDALLKIENGSDIYDVLHVVDELWTAKHLPTLKAFLQHDWGELTEFSKDFLIGPDGKKLDRETFEKWKKELGHLYAPMVT
ncbi:hypothetical protein A2619_01650 [candidate division WWE3 bacterium RIFOXYD1_FULL_39_9]|uniref:Glycoside hydrolase family 57 N-terminal domain-containing protein n=2 Tax=Katanobacteria TaxID=422282 RepID=A0A1F4X5Y3_UNCKA|nr:MAG: hypothetical protein A2619_01650 [candidate division WWE3 bacterium RIFOXYD1_FULL_39_9]